MRTSFYENGKKKTEETYVGGNLQGSSKFYDAKGKIIEEFNYKRNHLDGIYVKYEKGKKIIEGTYKNGLKEGEWISYDEKGNPIGKSVFKRGKLITSQE